MPKEINQIDLSYSLAKIAGLKRRLNELINANNKDWYEYANLVNIAIFEAENSLEVHYKESGFEDEQKPDKKLYPCIQCGSLNDDEYLWDGVCEPCLEKEQP